MERKVPLLICAGLMGDRHGDLLKVLSGEFHLLLHASNGRFDAQYPVFQIQDRPGDLPMEELETTAGHYASLLEDTSSRFGGGADPVEQKARLKSLTTFWAQGRMIESSLAFLHKKNPVHAVLCGNDFLAPVRALVLAARKLGIPTYFFNHGTMNFIALRQEAYKCYTPTIRPPVAEHILIESDDSGDKEAAERFGPSGTQFHVIGIPSQSVGSGAGAGSPSGPGVSLVYCPGWAEANTAITSLFYEYFEHLAFRRFCRMARNLGNNYPEVRIFLKLHPTQLKICGVDLSRFFIQAAADEGIELQCRDEEFEELIQEADLLVNSYCSSTNEIAFYRGIPSITLWSELLESFLREDQIPKATTLAEWGAQKFLKVDDPWEKTACQLIEQKRNGSFLEMSQSKISVRDRLGKDKVYANIIKVLKLSGEAGTAVPTSRKGFSGPLKILQIVHDFPPNSYAGTELYTLNLSKALQACGHEVTVVYPIIDKSRPQFEFRPSQFEGIPVLTFNLASSAPASHSEYWNPGYDAPFKKLLDRSRFNLVHFQHVYNLSATWIKVCKDQGLPVLLKLDDMFMYCQTYHLVTREMRHCSGPESYRKCAECVVNEGGAEKENKIKEIAAYAEQRRQRLQSVFSLVDYVHTPSQFLRESFEKYGFQNSNFHVLPTGIQPFDRSPKKKPDREKVTIGFMGTLALRKGILDFVAAVQLVESAVEKREASSKLHFKIYGGHLSDALYDTVIQKVEQLSSLEYAGKFLPQDRAKIFSNVDLLVVPSIGENYPFIIREALYAGVPVAATEIAGVSEIVFHGKNGFLYAPGKFEDLADIFNQIAADPDVLFRLKTDPLSIKLVDEEAENLAGVMDRLVFESNKPFSTSPDSHSQQDAEVLNQKGEAYYRERDYVKAISSFLEAVKINPKHQTAYNNLGVVSWEAKNYSDAETFFKKCLEISPDHESALLNLWELYLAQGRRGDGVRLLERTLSFHPNLPEVRKLLETDAEFS